MHDRFEPFPQNKSTQSCLFGPFLPKGQVIETFRGAGIYQPAVDVTIEKRRKGECVRALVFPGLRGVKEKCARGARNGSRQP